MGGRGGQLRGAAGQVGLRAPALHLVHPETALLAQVLQAAEGEEREQRYFGGREAPLQVSPAQSRALPGAGVLQLRVPQLPARSMDGGRGGSAPPPCAPALPSTPRQQLGLEGAPVARWGPLPSGNSRTGAVPQRDGTTPGTSRGSLWAVFIAPAQGSALLCLHPRCAGQGWGASWLLPSPALPLLKPPGRGHRHGQVPHTPSREHPPSLAPPFTLLTTVPQLHVPGAPRHVPPARWHPAPRLVPFPTGRSWC